MDNNGRPNHIEDFLSQLYPAQWFTWAQAPKPRKVYANLILTSKYGVDGELVDNPRSLPTEQECTDGLLQLQTDFDNAKTKQTTDSTSGKTKLKDLGLTDDEIKALTGK